jgi:hypothetical protein
MKTCKSLAFAPLTPLAVLGWLSLISIGSAQERASLPFKVNLVPKFQELALAPRAQKNRDTCSLFAITALAEFEYARRTSPPYSRLSEEFLIWAANDATGLKGDQAMFYEAAHGLNALGICTQELIPYGDTIDADSKPSQTVLANARVRSGRWQVQWIKRWDLKRPLSDTDMLAIKAALARGHPVACGLRWPKALKKHELLDVPPPDKVFDGHSIVFVGYEDDLQVGKISRGKFLFRNSLGPRWGNDGYGVMSYAYARTYANDALWLKLGPPKSEIPVERFEAELLSVRARERCDTAPQQMASWGGRMWSQGRQLFCKAEKDGFVELDFTVSKPGSYRIRILATAAPNFGKIRIALDGDSRSPEFDLYSGRVCPSGSLELGNRKLAAGKHSMRFTAVGKNAMSTNFFIGLDAIDLIAAD